MEGDGPRYEIVCDIDSDSNKNLSSEPLEYFRARVLCSYDAKDHTELNLIANEVGIESWLNCLMLIDDLSSQVIFVAECTPINSDYLHGKQGLLKGLVPRAFLECID